MMELRPRVGRRSPGDIDRGTAEVGGARIDREQARGQSRLWEEV